MSSSNPQIINSDCIVIGGNITGLIIATILQRRGIKVTLLDQCRDIGGRLATRRISQEKSIEGVFDSGIQYLSVKNPQFQVWVDDWLKHKVIKEWCQGFGEVDGKPRYCGINGMSEIAKYLAKNLDVHTSTKIIEFSYEKKWLIGTQSERQYQGDMLAMTSPIPESLSLLDASFIPLPLEIRFSLEQIEYDSCIVVLALLEKPSNIPAPGGISLEDDSLVWLADNHQKGISPDGYAITLLATPKFSDYYWDSDDVEIVYKLVTAAADYLDSPVIKYQVHRWRYSSPKTFYNESCLGLLELPLVMAGDAFVDPTLEGSVMSGMAAGELICQRFRVY
ncbi:NAD(P)/FAD-dependent oxidoreductase [Pleurocapsa sp. PCC 7319]|uniref:NAD(P)/FAD-dependent oxidoreductase n=1 Tax=Pleurocapsa sp. PCC 7319 TaxID=118161 RepID=UPI00034AE2B1|nr:FAD-dependent oxidoreductase [Pleurocapsa sp. PCC 7319]